MLARNKRRSSQTRWNHAIQIAQVAQRKQPRVQNPVVDVLIELAGNDRAGRIDGVVHGVEDPSRLAIGSGEVLELDITQRREANVDQQAALDAILRIDQAKPDQDVVHPEFLPLVIKWRGTARHSQLPGRSWNSTSDSSKTATTFPSPPQSCSFAPSGIQYRGDRMLLSPIRTTLNTYNNANICCVIFSFYGQFVLHALPVLVDRQFPLSLIRASRFL